jgi:hypothetical protein
MAEQIVKLTCGHSVFIDTWPFGPADEKPDADESGYCPTCGELAVIAEAGPVYTSAVAPGSERVIQDQRASYNASILPNRWTFGGEQIRPACSPLSTWESREAVGRYGS